MIKLILLVAVFALGVDALMYDGAYTQAAWYEMSAVIDDLRANGSGNAQTGEQPT